MEFYKDVITRQTYAYVVTELSGVVRTYLVQDSGILKLLKVQSTRPAFTGSDLTGIQPSEVSPFPCSLPSPSFPSLLTYSFSLLGNHLPRRTFRLRSPTTSPSHRP